VRTKMTELVRELARLGVWIRLHYVYPYPHVDEVIPLMAEGKVLPYLDVPFQHSHPAVLRRMKRPASGEKNIERIRAWRDVCPELTIRSTFIAGFPGETDAQFEHLLAFLREAQLDRVGCFAYSPVEGATANSLDGALPDEVREERRKRLMLVQKRISRARLKRKVGKVVQVLVDEVSPRRAIGRSSADAPEIDGIVTIAADARLAAGGLFDVRITGSNDHDLTGVLA